MNTNAGLAPPTRVISGFTDSSDLLDNPEQLQARAAEDGYLFFRNFLPGESLLELRRQIVDILDRHGWIKKGTDPMEAQADREAIARSDAEDRSLYAIGVTAAAYREIQSLELFHRLPHHPKLISLYQSLLGEAVLPHPRHIARVLLPSPSYAPTPPHQDYIYIQGTHNFWTLWFPLGDCPVELGGLSVLKGSHREPVLDVFEARGAGGKESNLCGKDYTWVQDDYALGDILTFPSHMVHRGLPTQQPDRIRISLDIRYQSAHEPIDASSLLPHMNVTTWEEIYRNWERKDLQYYWKPHNPELMPGDPSLLRETERIC